MMSILCETLDEQIDPLSPVEYSPAGNVPASRPPSLSFHGDRVRGMVGWGARGVTPVSGMPLLDRGPVRRSNYIPWGHQV